MSPRPQSPHRPPRGNGRTDPITGLPTPQDIPEGATKRDWRIRAVGLVAAILITIAAMIYFFGDREFSPLIIVLTVLAAIAAIAQSVLVLLEFGRK